MDCVVTQIQYCFNRGCKRITTGYTYCSQKCREHAQKLLTSCDCKWCQYWKSLNIVSGISLVLYDKEHNHVIVGYENSGRYKGKYNITTGKIDWDDKGCRMNTFMRELYEELNICMTQDDFMKKIIYTWNHNGSSVIVLSIDALDIDKKNQELRYRLTDTTLSSVYREIDHIKVIKLDDKEYLDTGKAYTDYAREILSKLNTI